MSFNGYINNIVELVINYYQYKDQLLNSNIEYENSNDNKIIELYDDGKIRNATLIVSLNGETHSFEKVTFSFGGYSSLYYGKPGFNIKIRKRKNLYGRSQFKLRSDYRDATFLRSKLVCDMHNRLGLPSISANYVQLYVNNEDLGLYVLMDAYKLSWAELQYDDEKTETLYQCKDYNNDLTVDNSYQGCINENKDVIDESEWYDFLTKLSQATDVKDIEDIFDVDQFLYEMAFEYLLGSWDHFLNYGHNFYVYRPKNQKKFQIMLYDFDAEFGQDIDSAVLYSIFEDIPNFMDGFYPQYPFYRFKEWAVTSHLINILILKDTTRFNKCLKTIVEKVFNPATLFPHIDKLKKLIKPYVEKGKIPDNNGKYIGIYNDAAPIYSLKEWDANSEFTTIETASGYRAYGIKYWILAKYGYVCKIYDIKCDSSYINGNYQYSVDKSVESDENYSILNKSVQKNNNSTIEFSLDPNLNLDQEENTDNNSNSSSTIIHTTLKFLISIYILLFVLF
ncbi:hypothetical protein BCR32DRAFT_227827 [Anaeromyces robustus]|uniref:Coth-domain-containing protein n=1 Tax=Anaeromyces robustus TaxID=1754192 RepID=A0A1Y1XQU2_9FUNG|nr:hypothetical protein BCR32DRAFT_227827 [Anaeromyces robustus]|eukprot:ORX87684.1 hypothetical protein BCR32DRAFT_227827 [Anaeromyces robustus]